MFGLVGEGCDAAVVRTWAPVSCGPSQVTSTVRVKAVGINGCVGEGVVVGAAGVLTFLKVQGAGFSDDWRSFGIARWW